MTPERLAELRAELDAAGFVVNSRQFWEAAAAALRSKEVDDRRAPDAPVSREATG
jgi:hypothetical protein